MSTGLIVNAKQTYYPIELSNSELLSHYDSIQEYQSSIASNMISQSNKFKPILKLIEQQPEMHPSLTRIPIVTFLYELSVMTRVTNGIFFAAVRLYDRYCSKRVVLKDQAKLVVATCLWLAAKTYGGCNHIINNVVIPTGGRFYGPNPRARIPRLSELVHYCGGSEIFDESMFLQMERHILTTLNWDVYEPTMNDYLLNVDENCLIQYELYERQLEYKNKWSKKRESQTSQDSDATVEEQNDEDLKIKIQLINLKQFLIDLTCFQYELLDFELFEITSGILQFINKFTNQDQISFLAMPSTSLNKQNQLFNIFVNATINTPNSLLEVYKEKDGIDTFIKSVQNYHTNLQKKLQLASSMDLSRRITVNTCYPQEASSSIPSPVYSTQSFTPMRNASAQSENSIFSAVMGAASPLTPTMYTFQHQKNDSACTSSLSVASLPANKRAFEEFNGLNAKDSISMSQYNEMNKENILPKSHQIPQPRAKFINTGIFQSPTGSINSSQSSLISLPIGNVSNMA